MLQQNDNPSWIFLQVVQKERIKLKFLKKYAIKINPEFSYLCLCSYHR